MVLRMLPGLLAVVLLTACGGSEPIEADSLPDDAVITYAFHDASVPPAYHRSILLTVTREEARIVVDSYGDVLADQSVPMPAAAWSDMSGSLGKVTSLTVSEASDGCVGGTAADLLVLSGGEPLVDVSASFCGGSNEKAGKAMGAWVAPARELFPTTDVLAPS